MPKTIHYNDDGSSERILDAFVAEGRQDTATFEAAVEAEVVQRISTSGSYDVNNATELTAWISNLVAYVFDNAEQIKDQE